MFFLLSHSFRPTYALPHSSFKSSSFFPFLKPMFFVPLLVSSFLSCFILFFLLSHSSLSIHSLPHSSFHLFFILFLFTFSFPHSSSTSSFSYLFPHSTHSTHSFCHSSLTSSLFLSPMHPFLFIYPCFYPSITSSPLVSSFSCMPFYTPTPSFTSLTHSFFLIHFV